MPEHVIPRNETRACSACGHTHECSGPKFAVGDRVWIVAGPSAGRYPGVVSAIFFGSTHVTYNVMLPETGRTVRQVTAEVLSARTGPHLSELSNG